MLRTQAHKDTHMFLRKYKLLILKKDTTSRSTNTDTLVISIVLFVLVYLEASISAFFFLSNREDALNWEASSGKSDEYSAGPIHTTERRRRWRRGRRRRGRRRKGGSARRARGHFHCKARARHRQTSSLRSLRGVSRVTPPPPSTRSCSGVAIPFWGFRPAWFRRATKTPCSLAYSPF